MPIIKSLLDTDYYKLTMGQFVFHRYGEVDSVYGFTNRSVNVRLGDEIDILALRKELNHVRSLQFRHSEIEYLASLRNGGRRVFQEDYLSWLLELKMSDYELSTVDGQLELKFYGKWPIAIYWETFALAVINEIYFRKLISSLSLRQQSGLFYLGRQRLSEKDEILHNWCKIIFAEFGTRRRLSRRWQDAVVRFLKKNLSSRQFFGTSNVFLARKYGLNPIGTTAHEIDMGLVALASHSEYAIKKAHNRGLEEWRDEYGAEVSIALTDTFGTEFFFSDMTAEQARKWKGLRQDSGDPMVFGEKAIEFYCSHGINPRKKLIIFSDGLDINKMIAISNQFKDRIKVAFGWGTNLTNDLGFSPVSIVIKLISVNSMNTVKLSDNLAKAIGNKEDIEKYKRVFGYTGNMYETCIY